MSDLNKTMHIGRLTADPIMSQLPTGMAKASFTIANNYSKMDKTQEVNFFDCVVFGKLAEVCGTYLKKGKQIAIIGNLRQQRWQDKNTGANRSRVEIIVNEMQMIGPREDKEEEAVPPHDNRKAPPVAPPPQAGSFDDDEVPF